MRLLNFVTKSDFITKTGYSVTWFNHLVQIGKIPRHQFEVGRSQLWSAAVVKEVCSQIEQEKKLLAQQKVEPKKTIKRHRSDPSHSHIPHIAI